MLTVSEAQLVIDSWVKGHSPDRSTRLGSALAQRSNTRGLGADAAVLIRQVLRHADGVRIDAIPEQPGVTPGTKAWLRLPRDDRFDWKSYGLTSTVHAESVEVTADEWVPDWLSGGSVVDHEVAAGELRRINESVAPDPFLQEIDRSVDSYRTPAQRSAVRSALLLPPGGTLLVNLPTGAGKTLPLLARALLTPPGRTSVIVVPTVALALDQQRRYAEQRPEAPLTAYFGDLTSDAKLAFLNRLRNGQQPVIFTNPEAMATSLARPLGDAAEGGRLELVGIDEAHIVGAWGDSFRPFFHALAGLRNALLRKAVDAGHDPFRTLLATATVTTETLELLRALFGTPGPFFHVAAPVIRAEPIYWSHEFVKAEDRLERLVEALRFLPRPAIVYTTLRSDGTTKPGILTPRRLLTALSAQGFERVAVFDGESSAIERQRVLDGFGGKADGTAFDLVLGTSAFGLGIDVPDVRTIIHACFPESLDRFYQEVGRAGRDGRTSFSLCLYTRGDVKEALSMASPKLVTSETARTRWQTMFNASRTLPDSRRMLPITATHSGLKNTSEYNEKWNLFTLGLLARSGALKWDFDLSARHEDDVVGGSMNVEVLRGDLDLEEFWAEVEPVRSAVVTASQLSLKRLQRAMSGQVCLGDALAEHYSIDDSPPVRALPSCGGCRFCRENERKPRSSRSLLPPVLCAQPKVDSLLAFKLATARKYGRRLLLSVDSDFFLHRRRVHGLVKHMVESDGVGFLVAPITILARLSLSASLRGLPKLFVDTMEDFAESGASVPLVGLFFLDSSTDQRWLLEGVPGMPLAIVVVDEKLLKAGDGQSLEVDGHFKLSDYERLR